MLKLYNLLVVMSRDRWNYFEDKFAQKNRSKYAVN